MSEAERLHELVSERFAQAQESAVLAEQIAKEVAKLTGSARSDNGGVHVVVDHLGLVDGVTFTGRAMDDGVDVLRETVLDTTRAAVEDLRAQAELLQAPLRAQASSLDDTEVMDAYDRLLTERFASMDGYTSR